MAQASPHISDTYRSIFSRVWEWGTGARLPRPASLGTRDYIEEHDLYDERNRAATLRAAPDAAAAGWRVDDMAEVGFYYHPLKRAAACYGCNLEVPEWHPKENPATKHWILAPECPVLLSSEECARFAPRHRDYIDVQKRIDSFRHHGWNRPQSAEAMAEAGFYYTGNADVVKCFCCGTPLNNWVAEDVPWEEHKFWSPECQYVWVMRDKSRAGECSRKWRLPPNVVEDVETKGVSDFRDAQRVMVRGV